MATITKSDELRLYNRSRILACLRNNNSQSRTGISELTGLSGATVTQVTADLIDDGIIEQIAPAAVIADTDTSNSRRGRPQVILGLCARAASTAVITLLLNRIEVTLFDYAGNQLQQQNKHLITSDLSVKTLTRHLLKLVDKTLAGEASRTAPLKHIAVVYQGTVSSDNNSLMWSPITGVRDFDLATVLQNHYGVGVTVLNDCKMIASALYQEQQHPNSTETPGGENFAAILLSYGIGLGLFHQGTILTGSHSSGTEFGHMLLKPDGALCRCGRKGCIEAYASDYAIWRKAMQQSESSEPADEIDTESFRKLIDKAHAQPGPERDAFAEAGAAIGLGLTNLFSLFDPFPVVLVGTTSHAYSLMETSLQNNLRHFGALDKHLISVHESKSERSLIIEGASMLTLAYLDREIFGFGERVTSARA